MLQFNHVFNLLGIVKCFHTDLLSRALLFKRRGKVSSVWILNIVFSLLVANSSKSKTQPWDLGLSLFARCSFSPVT